MTADARALEVPQFPWWLVLLEGIAALIFGILLLIAPGATLVVVIQITGFFWLIKGIFQIVSIFMDSSLWGWKLFAGILGILAGLLVLQHPLWSAVLVPSLIVIILGVDGLIFGVVGLFTAFKGAGWGVGILGVLSILFGILLMFNPVLGAAALAIILGIFAIIGGITSIVMAFQMR
jgi:uncharacterized membrane protein HdeD (DUF308 family)